MKDFMLLISIALVFMVLGFGVGSQSAEAAEVACYEGGDELIKPEYRVSTLLLSATWFDTEEELQDALDDPEAEALSDCVVSVEADTAWCEVWLVMPTKVLGDPHVDGVGHEALHGFLGDYHD